MPNQRGLDPEELIKLALNAAGVERRAEQSFTRRKKKKAVLDFAETERPNLTDLKEVAEKYSHF